MLDYLKINKKILGYDNFKGMPEADNGNIFKGDEKLIKYIINFFNLSKIKIIKDDILNLKKFKKIPKLSLIYIDCDTYDTTDLILRLLSKKLSKKGLIVFDEAIMGKGGEGKAANYSIKNIKDILKSLPYKKIINLIIFYKKNK